jgi:hypothetical protein
VDDASAPFFVCCFVYTPPTVTNPKTQNQHPTNKTNIQLIKRKPGEAAQAACAALSLDTEACLDLFVGVLAVGLVLSLLAAVPIFKACRLSECAARPPPPPPALAVA